MSTNAHEFFKEEKYINYCNTITQRTKMLNLAPYL